MYVDTDIIFFSIMYPKKYFLFLNIDTYLSKISYTSFK